MGYKEEINKIVNDMLKVAKDASYKEGYCQGVCDFLQALKETKLTPNEIFEKLNPFEK